MASETSRSASIAHVDHKPTLNARRAAGILSALAILLFFMRLHTYSEPLENDLAIYSVIAHEMLKGRPLYTDLWDLRPPMIFWTYAGAELIAGYGLRTVFLLNIAAAWTTLLGSYLAVRELSGRRLGGLLAATFWTLVSGHLLLRGNQPNIEVFINAALVWGIYFVALALHGPARHRNLIVAGGCFALASLYRQTLLITPLFLVVALIFTLYRGQKLRHKWLPIIALVLPAVLAWGVTAAYFTAKGSFLEFFEVLSVMQPAHAGEISLAALPLLPKSTWFLLPLVGLGVIGAILGKDRRLQWVVAMVYLGSLPITVALSDQHLPQYFQLYLPGAIIVGAMGLLEVDQYERLGSPRIQIAMIVVNLTWLGAWTLPDYRLPANEWSRQKHGHTPLEVLNLSSRLNDLLQPDEQFYEYGSEAGFYFYGERTPPVGMINSFGLSHGPLVYQYNRRVIYRLQDTAPEMVIVAKSMPHRPIKDWIAERYSLVEQTDRFIVMAKRGGKLEARLAKQ